MVVAALGAGMEDLLPPAEDVRSSSTTFVTSFSPETCVVNNIVDKFSQLPYTVGWQDLKDLFRQAGMSIC